MYDTFWKIRLLAQRGGVARPMKFVYRVLEFLGGCTIPLATRFDGKPCLPHGVHGIFISAGARVGADCVIFQHVTIGSNMIPTSKGFGYPTVGRNCYIGAGAKIIGNVKIGDNVRIGANAVIHRDVPDNAVVTPAEQVMRLAQDLDNRYYTYRRGAWHFFEGGAWKVVEDASLFANKGAD